jgi:hypothetical protein
MIQYTCALIIVLFRKQNAKLDEKKEDFTESLAAFFIGT